MQEYFPLPRHHELPLFFFQRLIQCVRFLVGQSSKSSISPLNHFLKAAGCEPKFVLFLSGKTGSRKSTLAALMLSFFGKFTASELPLSFRDTPNSILHNAFSLKDVLTVIDDLHPSSRQEEQRMNGTAQAVMRAYGDRTGKGRLRADSTPMESRPPQGNAIITAEFAPDIGESGTARYFPLELKEKDVDLETLTAFQKVAADGTLQRCMYAYTQWIKETFLYSEEAKQEFTHFLNSRFLSCRDEFRKSGIRCHGRVPEAVAHLQMGMDSPVNTERQLRNPFAGILFCDKCGAIMKRYLPHPKESPTAWYRCPTRGCDCKMIKCEVVENSIHEAMEDWLEKYILEIEADQQPKADPIAIALEAVRGQLAQLQLQQENICEYLEKGVYTIDMFTKRNASLTKEINQLQSSEADLLRQQSEGSQKKQATVQIIPTTQHILENYPILTVAEKNRLWKLVMTKATVYRSPDSELTVNIYPNLPK